MAELVFPSNPTEGMQYQGYKYNLTDKVWVNLKSGNTVDVSVGNTTTLEPTEDAVVTNRGDQYNVVLDFDIPKGERGEKGDDGVTKIESVNGKEGVVVLDSADVNSLPLNILTLQSY